MNPPTPPSLPNIVPLVPEGWADYELIDSGEGSRLERFGSYTLVRPGKGILWERALPATRWDEADAAFKMAGEEEGNWVHRRSVPERWPMHYLGLTFWAKLTPFRHTGVFPEQAPHWDWIGRQIRAANRPVQVLNLFAYTGIATLAASAAGARVTHVDASKPSIGWARENAGASGFEDRPIRWILDDAVKFVRREVRRGQRYDAIIMDPPAFGRGPKGEVWKFARSFPALVEACRAVLAPQPLFVLITAYGINESALLLYNILMDWLGSAGGRVGVGELVLEDSTKKRPLSMAIYGRWAAREV